MSKKRRKPKPDKCPYLTLCELEAVLTLGLPVGVDSRGYSIYQAFRELHCGKARCELYANSDTACLRAVANDPVLKAEHEQAIRNYSAKKSGLVLPPGANEKKKVVTP